MASPAYAIEFSALVSGVTGAGAAGDVLVLNPAGSAFCLSTTANRGSRRSTGVALTPYTNNGTVEIQQYGQITPSLVPALGPGTASWVRVSALGQLERCTPSGSDDVCGWVETDGTFHACFGLLTAAIVNGTGGGGGATLPIDLAGGAGTVINQLPAANQAAQTLAGDVTGLTSATVVAKVNGASVPAAGALTTGNSAYVSGASVLTYSALNLAGGSGWVTGVLPAANQAAQTMTGDVTGTTAASVVAKVNGATYPAAGALTTGTVPRVTGASSVAYGALDLANASAVTGVLPTGNQAAQAMAGDVTGTTAASVVAKINGATVLAAGALTAGHVLKVTSVSSTTYGFVADGNVSATAAIAGTKISPNFGAQDVVTTGSCSVGTSPAASGDFRLPGISSVKFLRAGSDYNLVSVSAGSFVAFGDNTSTEDMYMRVGNGGTYRIITTSGRWAFNVYPATTSITAAFPITGEPAEASPYSVHGRMPVHALAAATTYTVAASEYAFQVLQFSSTTSSACTITLPDPPNEAGCYFKDIDVTQCNVSQTVTFKAGAGTRTAAIAGSGAAAPGVPKRIFVSPGCVDLAPG